MNILNAKDYIETFLKIRDKNGEVIDFKMNPPQRRLYDAVAAHHRAGKPVRIIVLKARQMGFSTLTEAMIFFMTATRKNTEGMIVAHKEEATNNLFRMSLRYYENLPDEIKPMIKASNAQELVFDKPSRVKTERKGLASRIRCATAGGEGVGRSYTLRCLHLSEFAFWPGDKRQTFAGLMQSVPDVAGTMVIIESTANGYEEFKNMWDTAVSAQEKGEDGFIPVFFAWHEMPDYRRPVPPGFMRTPEECKLAETYHLDDEQLAWRRWCIATNCAGDLNLFKQEYPASPDEAFLATGECVFDAALLVLRRQQVKDLTPEKGRWKIKYNIAEKIESWQWETDPRGSTRIFKHPEKGVPYVIGADTAGPGSDYFAAHVLDNRTGEQVAVLHHQFGEREFAEQVYCLGKYYNDALLGVETNYSTYPQLKLEELGYRNFYVRQRVDTYTGRLTDAFGVNTSASTRPLMVDTLRDVAQHNIELIQDHATLGEMLSFIYDERRRPQAEQGEHDDLVMSLAIAHYIRPQQRTGAAVAENGKRIKWTDSMREDYARASKDERAYLRKKWGDPN